MEILAYLRNDFLNFLCCVSFLIIIRWNHECLHIRYSKNWNCNMFRSEKEGILLNLKISPQLFFPALLPEIYLNTLVTDLNRLHSLHFFRITSVHLHYLSMPWDDCISSRSITYIEFWLYMESEIHLHLKLMHGKISFLVNEKFIITSHSFYLL